MPIRLLAVISLLLVILLGTGFAVTAQDEVVLILESETTTLQTGQEYEIVIRLDNAQRLWALETEISFDSNLLYVMGTESGSPIHQGDFFPSAESVTIRNRVERQSILYTTSLLAPAQPRDGGGVAGRFRIYPLRAGTTQILFQQAKLAAVKPVEGEDRYEVDPDPVAFVPVLLELTIEGDPVEPPDEATATPAPTATATDLADVESTERPTQEPTLVNVTLPPELVTPEASAAPTESTNVPLLLAIAVLIVSGIGMVLVLILYLRRRE